MNSTVILIGVVALLVIILILGLGQCTFHAFNIAELGFFCKTGNDSVEERLDDLESRVDALEG